MLSQSNTTPERYAKPPKRRWYWLLFPAFTSQLILLGCGGSDEAGSDKQASAADVGYIELQPQAINRLNLLPGRVIAYQVAEIRPQVSGIIQSRLFEEGAYVEEGQQLYQIDPARYEADYDMSQATLEDAKAQRQSAQALATRYAILIESNAVSEQEYDEAISALNQAKAAISMAKAQVKIAKINLDYTGVHSPISGYISPSTVTKGALVTEGQPAPLATVLQLNPVYVDLSQSVTTVRNLRERLTPTRLENDAQATFPVRLFPTSTEESYEHEGTLNTAELAVDPQTGNIRLRSVFPNPDNILLPGMFVRASVEVASRAKAIIIPQKSVKIEPDGKQSVWVIDSNDRAQKRSIRTGVAYQNRWVVLEGLEAGERLIVEGTMKLTEGAELRPEKINPEG
jgi:membrane fusion protein (multidrug efflux system)